MSNGLQKSQKRDRREWEDKLLQGRTAIFLVLNGFAVQREDGALAVAIAVIDCLWVLASLQSWIIIRALAAKAPADGAQSIVNQVLGSRRIHHAFRPTTIVAVWIL